ncbi:hypothetical protein K445DRAFT_136759 [Daldinia sp. EC12]|nr:hypothetical protein K445DRAFT_136759 [Daldinia sp. EC12]
MHATCHSFGSPGNQACPQQNIPPPPPGSKPSLSELTELFPAVTCSFLTTCYIVRAESPREDFLINIDSHIRSLLGAVRIDLLLQNVPPGLALVSCLVLGCCLSSYTHRRRDRDPYQPLVFAAWILWAMFIGWGTGISASVVTLGVIPWASCAAMLSSFFGHVGARWVSNKERSRGIYAISVVNEKGISLDM